MPVTTSRNCNRRGTTLVELMVALPVGALIAALAVSLLLDSHKVSRRLDSSTKLGRELRQAASVLASEIRPLAATDLVSWTDTSIEIHSLVGSGVVCARSGSSSVDMLPLGGSDVIRTSWFATPQAGDLVNMQALDSSVAPQDGQWTTSVLHSTTTSSTSNCLTSPLATLGGSGGNAVRLTMTSPIALPPSTGSLVRIARRARYSLYRASDGLWYLGRKSSNGSTWTTIQPVAGPFDRPQVNGLRIEVRDSANTLMLSGASQTPRSVALVLKASSEWKRTATSPGVRDSVLLHVALRGQMEPVTR